MKVSALLQNICVLFFLLLMIACSSGGSSDSGGGGSNLTPDLVLTRTSYDFSGIVINNSADHTFEIGNNGKADLQIRQISALASPYSIPAASDACSNQTLRPLEVCSFEVRFEPTNQGKFSGQVSVPSNDPGGTASINLSGEGYGLNVWIKKATTDAACVATVGITVTDDAGNILDAQDLNPGTDFSFEVDQNTVAQENVTFHAYETPSPVSVVLAIDTSGSEKNVLDTDIKNAAISFINQLDTTDEAAICNFSDSVEFEPAPDSTFHDLATQKQDLINYIETLSYGEDTSLYNALYASVDRAADGIATNKHLVVVLSDGVNTISGHTLDQVIAHAEDKDVTIFTIYYRDPNYGDGDYGDPNVLKQISDSTGGQDYDGTTGGLDNVYFKIVSTIRNMFIFELNIPGCSTGSASLDLSVDDGDLYGKDSTTITFP